MGFDDPSTGAITWIGEVAASQGLQIIYGALVGSEMIDGDWVADAGRELPATCYLIK